MILPTDMMEQFIVFCEMLYGSKIRRQDPPFRGEYARFMIGDSIVLVRDHNDDSQEPLTVEVFCSNSNKLDELSRTWAGAINQEEEKPNE